MGFWDFLRGPSGSAIGNTADAISSGIRGARPALDAESARRARVLAGPADIKYTDIYNPERDALSPYAQQQLGGVNMNQEGLNRFRSEALRTGPSAWSRLANEQQRGEESQARESVARQVYGANAGAMSQLAMRGGIDSGARERMARSGAQNMLNMGQDIRRQGSLNRMQIGMNDEQNRITQLGMLPGMESQFANFGLEKAKIGIGARQGDIANQIANQQGRNIFDLEMWKKRMEEQAAERQAQATERNT